jgi:hypothetical protein
LLLAHLRYRFSRSLQLRDGVWSGSGDINISSSASFINSATGNFVFSSTGSFKGPLGVQVVNRGTITTQGTSTVSAVLVDFQNYGSIVVAQGTLAVAAGTNWNNITVQTGSILRIDPPSNGVTASYFFDRASTVTVSGQLLVNSGSLIVLSTYDASKGSTTITAGMLDVRYGRLLLTSARAFTFLECSHIIHSLMFDA